MNEFDFGELYKQAEVNLENFKKAILYVLNSYYKKPFVLDYRIKSKEKLLLKQKLLEARDKEPVTISSLADIVGFRISVDTEDDVKEVSQLINKLFRVTRCIDYFSNPSPSGFKAFMYYFEDNNDSNMVNTEIQVMTKEMMHWTNETHKEVDERKYGHIK